MAKLAVVHVNAALPYHAARINPKLIALLDMVIKHRGAKVIRSTYRMKITREVQIDVLHGNNLRISAACGSAFNAKNRSERRFAECQHCLVSRLIKCIRQTNRGGSLALPCRSRVDGRYQNKLAALRRIGKETRIDLCLVTTIRLKKILTNTGSSRYINNRKHRCLLSDLDIGLVLRHNAPHL